MTMTPDECFAALGTAPTMDAAVVKLAYFKSLKVHPPHLDPTGFRRLRAAYEQLGSPDALAAAFMSCGGEAASALFAYAKLDAALAAVAAAEREARPAEVLIARFEAFVPAMTWEAALEHFGARAT